MYPHLCVHICTLSQSWQRIEMRKWKICTELFLQSNNSFPRLNPPPPTPKIKNGDALLQKNSNMHIRPFVPSAVPSVPFLARCLVASSPASISSLPSLSSSSSSSASASSLGHPSPRSAALQWRRRGRGNANSNASSAHNAVGGVIRPFSTTARLSKPFTEIQWRARAKRGNTDKTISNPKLGERIYLFANERFNSVAYSHDSTFDVRLFFYRMHLFFFLSFHFPVPIPRPVLVLSLFATSLPGFIMNE